MEELLRARLLPHGIARRLSALLLLSEGASLRSVRAHIGLQLRHIVKWRERFAATGVEGLVDRPRPGRPKRVSAGPATTHPWRCRAEETSWGEEAIGQAV